jgi:SAM-dependent methyltransferase
MPEASSRAVGAGSHEGQEEILRRMRLASRYNEWLLNRARPYLGQRVLDAGAGTGTFTEALMLGREVVAMEPEPAFASQLRRRFADASNVSVVQIDASDLCAAVISGPVDSIVCLNVLEHVAEEVEALRRFRDVLTPNGHLCLLVPAHPRLFGSVDRTVDHKRRYTKRHMRWLLDSNDFVTDDIRYVNPLGAVGWFLSARLLKRPYIPTRSLRFYDRLVPALQILDRLELPFGLSVWAVARRPLGA